MRWLSLVVVAACSHDSPAPKPTEPGKPAVVVDAAVAKVAIDAPAVAVVDAAPLDAPVADVTSSASKSSGSGSAAATGTWKLDGDKLRKQHRDRIAADTSAVTMLAGKDPRETGKALCEAVVPQRAKDTPILLKPNLGGFDWFHDPKTHHGDDGVHGRITDPEFVHGVIDCLQARGHTNIVVADGFTGVAADWTRLTKVSGYAEMTKAAGVKLVALDDDGVFDKDNGPGSPIGVDGLAKTHVPHLLVPKLVAEAIDHGMFITIPKLKTHRYAVFSLAIKGMQGTTMYSDASPAFHQKWRTHIEIDGALKAVKANDADGRAKYVKSIEIFAERLADILELEAPDVELAEGMPAMDGDGFEVLVPTGDPVAIGGTNVIAVDKVGAQFLGLYDSDALAAELGGYRTSPILAITAKRFGVDLDKVTVTGDGAKLLDARRPAHLIGMAGFEIDERAKK